MVGDDGCDDDTRCKSDDHRICDNQSPKASTCCTLRANNGLSTRFLIVWAGFSVMATALQWLLQKPGLLTTMMQSSSYYWSAALFGAAGLYQLSPLKETCLAYCRSPDAFVLTEWRDGALGAVVMGLRHGLFCMGCCAALMLLLFAVAVMDLRWVVALTVLVTSEKILPGAKVWRLAIAALLMAIAIGFALAGWRSA